MSYSASCAYSRATTVLEIGTGGGAALAAARIVGDGKVVGADISAPLVAEAQHAANASFIMADVQHETVPSAPFNAAISQFGVMLSDQPQVAFANIRRHLVNGGRFGFACWQAPDLNPWFPVPGLAKLAPPQPPPEPGKSPTHPFSLSDPQHTAWILEVSGWREITSTRHDWLSPSSVTRSSTTTL